VKAMVFQTFSISFAFAAFLDLGGFQGQQVDTTDTLGVAAGVLALILLSLSIYAWSKRRQPSLLIASAVFFLFFLKVVLEIIPSEGNTLQFLSVILDFLILLLLFLAVVVKPRIGITSKREKTEEEASK